MKGNYMPNEQAAAPNLETSESQESSQETQVQESSANAPESNNLQTEAQPSTAAKEAKKRTNKLKLKVYGQDVEETLPFDVEDSPEIMDYLTKNLQMSKAASKKMNEYSQLEKEVSHFLQELKKNPKKVLADPNIGIDIKQLAASIIEEEINNSQKTPEQLEKEKLEAELQAIKSEREKEKEEAKAKEFERLQQQEFERYDTLMTKALEKSDLPKSPYVVKKMADYMLLGLQNNINVSPEDVLPLVREEMVNDLKEMFAIMPEDVIENIIGKETINKLRKKKVAAIKSGAPTLPKQTTDSTKESKEQSNNAGKKQTFKDFFGV